MNNVPTAEKTLSSKVAFVTGAGGGIGRAISLRLAAAGAHVIVADIDSAAAEATVAAVHEAAGLATAVTVDITSFAAVQAAFDFVREQVGAVDVLVNNAGWDRLEPFVKNEPSLWRQLIAINLEGPIHCSRAAIDHMVAQGGGKIISISSDAARVGSTGEAVYSACKGGILSFSKTLARELARHRINVNVVCPGPTDTPLLASVGAGPDGAKVVEAMKRAIPLRRLGQPDDIAGAVLFFATSDADFITGQALSVSGGLTMAG